MGSLLHGQVGAAVAGAPGLPVAAVVAELPARKRPVPLGGQQVPPVAETTFEEVDVGLLARLEHASLDLVGGVLGDHPPGWRLRTVFGVEVGALTDIGIGLVQVGDEGGKWQGIGHASRSSR